MNSLYLIAKESWIQVIDLDRIKVTNDADMYRGDAVFNIMRATLLPDMRKTYAQNLRKYVGAPVFREVIHQVLRVENADIREMVSLEDYDEEHFLKVMDEVNKEVRT